MADETQHNVLRGENIVRQSGLRLASLLFGVLTIVCIAFPFSSFLFDQYTVQLTGIQLILTNIRINPDLLLHIPLGMRIFLVLSLVFSAAGLAFMAASSMRRRMGRSSGDS